MRKCCANNTVDKDWLYEQYITNGKTRYEISDMSGLTPGRIGTLLQQYSIIGLKHKIIVKWKYRHGIDYVIDQLRDEISRRKEQI